MCIECVFISFKSFPSSGFFRFAFGRMLSGKAHCSIANESIYFYGFYAFDLLIA